MSLRRLHPAASLPLLLALLLPRPADASWPSNSALNVALCTATQGQRYPQAVPDGTGGAIVAWDDQRGGPRDIFAQRVDGTGTVKWTANGVLLCGAAQDQYEPQVVADGAGGAIVTWVDFRNGANFDLYAQRVDSTGTPKWAADGVVVCNAANYQSHPAIVPDGAGGAIIAWDDERSGITQAYAQRLNGNGAPQWTPNGVKLTTPLSGQARPVAVSNGAGGAVIAWYDVRNGGTDLYGQRILSTGAIDPAWPAAGLAIALLGGDQEGLAIAGDGAGGAYVGWAQFNGGTRDVRLQRVLASGAFGAGWPSLGVNVAADGFDEADPALLADGAGGVLVAWTDPRAGTHDIWAQHVLSTGAFDAAWPVPGRALTAAPSDDGHAHLVSDGAGGAIATWEDWTDSEADVFAQHLKGDGTLDPAWPADGRGVATAALRQLTVTMVPNGAGGAVLAWEDSRNDPGDLGDSDIYAQGVNANGQLGDAPVGVPGGEALALALDAPSPNPARGAGLTVRFALASGAPATLALFDVAGRRIAAREVGALGAGRHAVDLARAARPAAGVYFVRLEQQGQGARTRSIVVLD